MPSDSLGAVTPHTLQASPSGALGRGPAGLLVTLGVIYWFVAALAIRFAIPSGWYGGLAGIALFAGTWLLAWRLVDATVRICRLSPPQLVPGIALVSAVAMLCDGVALTWTDLYGSSAEAVLPAAALLLWGVAACLVTSLLRGRPEQS